MKKRLILILLIMITLFNISFAFEDKNFNYLNLNLGENNSANMAHYELVNAEKNKYFFENKISYNKENIKTCSEEIIFEENDLPFQKISCEFENKGFGEYTLEGFIYDENKNLLKKTIDKEYIFENSNSKMQFNVENDKTTITIKVKGNKPLIVKNEIPKEVIASLTKENQNSLIESNIPFEILEEDPLIAWNIEEPPATINYTINKKISIEEQKKFQLEIQNDSSFKFLKYIIFAIILIVIGLIIKPIFKKK